MYRGYVMSVLKQTKSIPVAVIVSAVIFSLIHSTNSSVSLLAFVNILLIGIFLASLFIKTGSLWIGIGFHIMWNYSQGNIYGFFVSGSSVKGIITTETVNPNILNGGAFGPEGGVFVTLATLLNIFLVFLLFRNRNISFTK